MSPKYHDWWRPEKTSADEGRPQQTFQRGSYTYLSRTNRNAAHGEASVTRDAAEPPPLPPGRPSSSRDPRRKRRPLRMKKIYITGVAFLSDDSDGGQGQGRSLEAPVFAQVNQKPKVCGHFWKSDPETRVTRFLSRRATNSKLGIFSLHRSPRVPFSTTTRVIAHITKTPYGGRLLKRPSSSSTTRAPMILEVRREFTTITRETTTATR